ncbi:MAG: V-type ATP synthase subunit I [Candidatus Nanoarchaeia archaeon]
MLRPEEMTKLRIYCHKERLKEIIEALYKAKAVDVVEHQKDENIDIGTPLPGVDEISDAAVKARSLLYRLKPTKQTKPKTKDVNKIVEDVLSLHQKVEEIEERAKEIDARQKHLKNQLSMLKKIESLNIPLELFRETNHIKYVLGEVDNADVLEQELKEKFGNNYEMHYRQHEKYVIAIFYEKSKEWELLKILHNYKFKALKIPEEYEGVNDPVKKVQDELNALDSEKKKLDKKLDKLKMDEGSELAIKEEILTRAAKIAEAPLKFGETTNISIITGWVPTKSKKRIENRLKEITKDEIHIEELKASKEDEVPIKLKNPNAIKPFEFLLRLFSMPSYKEIDPSLFLFITFPLFFGFMLGDIGYGVTIFILFYLLKLKFPQAKTLLIIGMYCAIMSVVFGAAYGEVYGFEITELFSGGHGEEAGHGESHTPGFGEWITTWPWHRNAENAINLIIISAIFGAIHVNMGLLIGFYNILKQHDLKHAILEKGGWFVLEAAIALIALSAAGILVGSMLWAGIGLIIIAIIMLYKGEGVVGVVELPSIVVHIASYMRLMAIGLASVGLAVVINEQSANLFSMGVIGAIGAIIVFTIGHIINIALGIIGPGLHSLRLHYVEYFTKFYEGGGKEFSPFGAEDK